MAVYVPAGAMAEAGYVIVDRLVESPGQGYTLALGLRHVLGDPATPADAQLELVPAAPDFARPVTLEFSLDGIADMASLPADRAAYVVTRDEASGTWVRVPGMGLSPASNAVLVETRHFSSWGAGVGPAFPADGAGVLLFDPARPDLFTGRARFSLPIWTPPGPGGLAPDLALSYSSGTSDGVLRDVQAPWTGWGWSLSTVEIARRVTHGECGPFGEARLTATLPTDRLFTGQRRLAGLGLDHFGARAYSPLVGRFLSADPLVPDWANPQSLNRYAFVLNNPLRYTDPTGLSYCDLRYAAPEDCAEAGIVSTRTPLPVSGSVGSALVTTSNDYCTRMPWECGGISDSHGIPEVYGIPQESVCVGLACDIRQDGLPKGFPTAQPSLLLRGDWR